MSGEGLSFNPESSEDDLLKEEVNKIEQQFQSEDLVEPVVDIYDTSQNEDAGKNKDKSIEYKKLQEEINKEMEVLTQVISQFEDNERRIIKEMEANYLSTTMNPRICINLAKEVNQEIGDIVEQIKTVDALYQVVKDTSQSTKAEDFSGHQKNLIDTIAIRKKYSEINERYIKVFENTTKLRRINDFLNNK